MAADPAAAKMIAIMRSPKSEAHVALAACREILNRAGIPPQLVAEVAPPPNNGQVLWDEFVAIYRRRVGVAAAPEEVLG